MACIKACAPCPHGSARWLRRPAPGVHLCSKPVVSAYRWKPPDSPFCSGCIRGFRSVRARLLLLPARWMYQSVVHKGMLRAAEGGGAVAATPLHAAPATPAL
eukprot:scaffold24708_cov67-Phaeocystis_antarctica.AAC.6